MLTMAFTYIDLVFVSFINIKDANLSNTEQKLFGESKLHKNKKYLKVTTPDYITRLGTRTNSDCFFWLISAKSKFPTICQS